MHLITINKLYATESGTILKFTVLYVIHLMKTFQGIAVKFDLFNLLQQKKNTRTLTQPLSFIYFWGISYIIGILYLYVYILQGTRQKKEEIEVIHERLLWGDYGRYDPSPNFYKPRHKMIPNWMPSISLLFVSFTHIYREWLQAS